jgi:hypothetical protein
MNATTLTENQITDIAINIVDDLVLKGYVPDCIDTEDETEFEIQDIIVEHLKKRLTV